MDNAPDSGPAKKPTPRTASRSTSTRKPAPKRKPAARKPAAGAPAVPPVDEAPAQAQPDQETVAEELEFEEATVLSPRDAELEEEDEAAAAVEPSPEAEPSSELEPESAPSSAPESTPAPNPRTTTAAKRAPRRPAESEASAIEPAIETAAEPEPDVEPAEALDSPATEAAAEEQETSGGSPAAVGGGLPGLRRWFAAASGARSATSAAPTEQPRVSDGLFQTSGLAKQGTSTVLSVRGLTKSFGDKVAVSGVDLEVQTGAFYGIVGPNGAGKTTTLSMVTGLLRPDSGTVLVNGSDVWTDRVQAKRMMGVLPDRLRLFDRLTGAQLLYYAGVLRGLDHDVVRDRTADLAQAFGLEASLGRLVSDYSAGMTKKIALAAAMIHSPRLLVLDEPFESVDPVSAATVTEILKKYVSAGGTVVLSSHSMDLVQRICDHVAVVVRGKILADGTVAEVRDGQTLEERFVELAGSGTTAEGLEWLHSFSD